MKNLNDLPEPNKEIIEQYKDIYQKDDKANYFDKAITEIVKSFPLNNNLENIILKISIINDLYSTNIFSKYELAKHILSLNFDDAIKQKDYNIVNRIAKGHGIKSSKTGNEFNFYSFATKYCSWHDQINYPIFDRYIDLVLKIYNSKNKYVTDKNFRNYQNLIEVLNSFRIKHKLENYSLKEIDKFLWYLGKEEITNKHKTK